MKKFLKLTVIIIFSVFVGAGIFSFVVAEKLYFPDINKVAGDIGSGLSLNAYQYDSWFWNKEKITVINIHDRKNDALNVEYKLKGEVGGIQLIHSGEDYALITYNGPEFVSMESGYIVHRSPRSESENTIEEMHIGGNVIAVAPDESGYFYISKNKIFKRSWQGETIMSAVLGMVLYPISEIQLTSVGGKPSFHPVLFFDNNTKMAFWATPGSWREGYIFIWDLESNKIDKIFAQDIGNYNDLTVEDDKLYMERVDSSLSRKLIAE
ncbi:MAG: hypothetical protein PF488_03470 [Patescibacteria group bacterium]|jgi:hypothetical protein|nr:hypothetical protein [Patescibacteria group bacterium]